MNNARTRTASATAVPCCFCPAVASAQIPLPEHPRPDFQRAQWLNLNGAWEFRFDKENVGLDQKWAGGKAEFPLSITVPFPWGSKLSGVKSEADIAWYRRTIRVPPSGRDSGCSSWSGPATGRRPAGWTARSSAASRADTRRLSSS